MTTTRRVPRLVALCLVVLALGASALATTSVSAGAASSNKLTVTATEYTYKMSGSPKPGNIELTFDNSGVEYHMLGMVALKDGVTAAQLKKALLSDDESAGDKLVKGKGEVSPAPAFLGPDQKSTTIVNLPAGNYGIFCFISAPDGAPHIAHGMVKTLEVSGSKSSYKPPTDGVVEVKLSDSAITLPSSGMPKSGWVKVTNTSSEPRDVILAQYLTPGATYETSDAYFEEFFNSGKFPAGAAPASLIGGVGGVPANGTAYFQVDFSSGNFTLVSSLSNADDDPNELHADFTVG